MINAVIMVSHRQCFHTVGWLTGRASVVEKYRTGSPQRPVKLKLKVVVGGGKSRTGNPQRPVKLKLKVGGGKSRAGNPQRPVK